MSPIFTKATTLTSLAIMFGVTACLLGILSVWFPSADKPSAAFLAAAGLIMAKGRGDS